MARCPFATWNPVDFTGELEHMGGPPRAVFMHTNGGGPHLTSWFDQLYAKTHKRVGATFQIFNDGAIDQLCDTESVIWAQYGASRWAVSVETEDDGRDHVPWTPAQVASIAKLLRWLHHEHGIPLRLMAGPTEPGIGYHQQFAIYNKAAHDCPGPVRLSQLLHSVIPQLAVHADGGDEDAPDGGQAHVPRPLGPLPLPWLAFDPDTRTWQRQMLSRGWSRIGQPDGVYGESARLVCEAFQREKGAPVTGRVDAETWSLAWTAPITH